jgi:hypothetical protein
MRATAPCSRNHLPRGGSGVLEDCLTNEVGCGLTGLDQVGIADEQRLFHFGNGRHAVE